MTHLQLALLLLAAVLLGCVFAYGKWQERQALRQFDQRLRANVGDALFGGAAPLSRGQSSAAAPPPGATEGDAAPTAAIAPAPSRTGEAETERRLEPRLGEFADTVPLAREASLNLPPVDMAAGASTAVPEWVEDPLLDFVLELRCAHAVDGVAVIDAAAPLARLGLVMPVYFVAWDARSQQWVRPDRFGFYSELLAATQLASRRHSLDEQEATQFVAAVRQASEALDADFDAPDFKRVLEMARDLDRLCAQFDVQIGLTLEADQPWDSTRLIAAALDAGLRPCGPMHWQRDGASGLPLFTLIVDGAPIDRVLLELDVPLAPAADGPLSAMVETANQLAAMLGARVVDDNGRPIDNGSVAAIERQLSELVADRRSAGLDPGAPRAMRLYS